MNVHPGPRGPGHKRQRSRSVPMAVDFSMFNNTMPSFLIQHPSETQHNPNIFAPIPQQANNLGPLGPNLRIDTSSGYGMDFRQYPMSAATTASPSEFASPGFFSKDQIPALSLHPLIILLSLYHTSHPTRWSTMQEG